MRQRSHTWRCFCRGGAWGAAEERLDWRWCEWKVAAIRAVRETCLDNVRSLMDGSNGWCVRCILLQTCRVRHCCKKDIFRTERFEISYHSAHLLFLSTSIGRIPQDCSLLLFAAILLRTAFGVMGRTCGLCLTAFTNLSAQYRRSWWRWLSLVGAVAIMLRAFLCGMVTEWRHSVSLERNALHGHRRVFLFGHRIGNVLARSFQSATFERASRFTDYRLLATCIACSVSSKQTLLDILFVSRSQSIAIGRNHGKGGSRAAGFGHGFDDALFPWSARLSLGTAALCCSWPI